MAATMTGLPLPGYNCYNRDGEADGGGKMECMSFMAATTTGSPVKDLPGHNTVEMTVVRKWALHSHDAIPTMSTHNPDGYGVGTSNVSLMSCFLFFSAFARGALYAIVGVRINHKWTIKRSDESVVLPHVLLVAGVVAVNRRFGACKGTGKGMSFCSNARIDKGNLLLQNCLHPHLLR